MGDMTEHFSAHEVACFCPNACTAKNGRKMDLQLMHDIELIRAVYDKAMTVTSGLRCFYWNEHEGGKLSSSHPKGLAIDIKCPFAPDRYLLVSIAINLYRVGQIRISRIGIGPDFIHFDRDLDKTQEVVWVY